MSEWWTYRLSDFLSFSPQTYYRLFELYNAAIWPGQILAFALGLAIWALLRRGGVVPGRIIAAILAACWLWVGIAFHANRYATITFTAVYFAGGFALQSALLIWIGVIRGRLVFGPGRDPIGRVGDTIFLFALLLQPLVGPVLGRGWRPIEIFGVGPDPTAIATLGVLLRATGRVRWELMVIPVIWCAISGATLWTMKAADAWIAPLVAVLILSLASWKAWGRNRSARP